MNEKRVKLGVDVGELSNELLRVNNLVEENYRKSIQGQSEYNKILEESIELLEKQAELVGKVNPQNSLLNTNSLNGSQSVGVKTQNSIMSESEIRKYLILIDRIRGTMNNPNKKEEAQNTEIESRENDLLRSILEDVDKIWEKMSEQTVQGGMFGGGQDEDNQSNFDNQNTQNNQVNNGNQGQNTQQKQRGGGGNIAANAFNSAAGLVQTDPNYIWAGIAGMIPWVGAGLSSIVSKLIKEAEDRDNASRRLRASTGGGVNFGSFENIGLRDADAFEKLAQYYSSNINLSRRDLEFEKGYNISGGTMDALLRSMRRDFDSGETNYSSSEAGVNFLENLVEISGLSRKEVRGYSEEYLKILVDLNQKQLETIGETHSILNTEIVQNIASLDKHFADPVVLSRVISNLQSGLVQAQSPQIEALQYYSLSKVNPNASIWELQLMKENPFGEESRGYLINYLEALLNTGTEDDAKFNIMRAFGLTAHQTEQLVRGIKEKGIESIEPSDIYYNTNAGDIISQEAAAATSFTQQAIAHMSNKLAEYGTPLINTSAKILLKLEEYVNKFTNWIGEVGAASSGPLANSTGVYSSTPDYSPPATGVSNMWMR